MATAMKTLGPQLATLVSQLHDRNKATFSLDDAAEILGSPRNIVSNLLSKAQARGVVTRLRRGLFTLVPFELGSETSYGGNPLTVAAKLLERKTYYLSHGTAMAIHGMTRQPQILVTASCVSPGRRHLNAGGTEIRVIAIAENEVFGTKSHWAEDRQKVTISDLERTIIDCLRRTDLCGGYCEIDAGAWMVRTKINIGRLVDHALRLGIGSVISRVGYLLDSCEIGTEEHRRPLRDRLTATHHLLDPLLPSEGEYSASWHLRENVSREELAAMRRS